MNIVLIHGAFHGAWCWELLTPILEGLGHAVIAPDLPISDRSAGASAYADAVLRSIVHDLDRPLLVVAHSLSGLVAPIVATRRPVARLVFLAAILPIPGKSADEQRDAEPWATYIPSAVDVSRPREGVLQVGPETAKELFFHDVPSELADWAIGRLQPQCEQVLSEMTPLTAWPEVPASYIVCRDDRSVDADWGRRAARARLRVEPVEIDGGHSPFLARPEELGRVIDAIARDGEREQAV